MYLKYYVASYLDSNKNKTSKSIPDGEMKPSNDEGTLSLPVSGISVLPILQHVYFKHLKFLCIFANYYFQLFVANIPAVPASAIKIKITTSTERCNSSEKSKFVL